MCRPDRSGHMCPPAGRDDRPDRDGDGGGRDGRGGREPHDATDVDADADTAEPDSWAGTADPGGPGSETAAGTGVGTESGPGSASGSGGVLDASVDSRWWWWIAAVPAFGLLSVIAAVGLTVLLVVGVFTVGAGGGGPPGMVELFTGGGVLLVGVLVAVGALVGLVLTVMFPIALYVDGTAVRDAGYDWDPDPLLYALVAVVGTLFGSFLITGPVALYYLYKRHVAVGVP